MSDWLWQHRGFALVALAGLSATVLTLLPERETPVPPEASPPAHPSVHRGVAAVTGRVVDEGARAIANTTVCAHCDGPGCPEGLLHVPVCTTTDGRGGYALGPLPGSLFWISAAASGYIPAIWDPGSGRDRADVRAGPARADFELQRGGAELRGTVVDLDGAGIGGAVVGALLSSGEHMVGPTTISDEVGGFALWLDTRTVRLRVRARTFATREITASAPGPARAVLRPGASIAGRVLHAESGEPVGGAHVGVADDAYGVWRRRAAAVVSDSDGNFEIEGLAAGRYTPYAATTNSYGEADVIMVGPYQRATVGLTVHPARSVSGRVVIDDLRPCTNGSLRLTSTVDSSQLEARLDSEGNALISPLLPGTYHASAHCFGTSEPVGPTGVEVDDTNVEGLLWRAATGLALRGVVASKDGEPLADVRVVATRDAETRAAITAADGTFVVYGLSAGAARVHAEVVDVPLGPETVVEITEHTAPIELLALAPGALTVRAVDGATSEPLAGFEVSVRGDHNIITNTGNDGRVVLQQLAPGEYDVIVSHPVGGRLLRDNWVLGGSQRHITVAAGQTTNITVQVDNLVGGLTGWVVDDEGNPVADVAVVPHYREHPAGVQLTDHVLMFSRHHPWRALTDEAGSFSITGLIPGTYDLAATHASGGVASVKGIATREPATLSLTPGGTLAGSANDREGNGPLDLVLSGRETSRGGERAQRFLRRGGHWRLDNLPSGTWELSAESSLGSGQITVELAPGQTITELSIRLEPRVTVSGTVVTFVGARHLRAVEVSVWPETGALVGVRRATTDAGGQFSLAGVPAGRAELRVRTPDDFVEFAGRILEVPAGGGDLGATRLVADPGSERGMYGFRPSWPPRGDTIAGLRVLVEDVKPDSPAGIAGLRIGDAIVAINGVSITGAEHYLFWGLSAATPGTTTTFALADGRELTMTAGAYAWP